MKYTIDKDAFDGLSEPLQGEYEEKDGAYVLKLEGHEDAFVPKHKKDEAEKHRKEAEQRATELSKQQEKLMADLEAAKGTKEIEQVRESHRKEVERIKAEYAQKEEAAQQEIHKSMIREEAQKFASEKFTVPSAISRLYQDRLTVERVGDKPVIRVLEADGSPSVKSLDDLRKEFLENKEFSPIIKASGGSGGGASPSHGANGGAGQKTISKADFEAMSNEERHKAFVQDGLRVAEE